MPPSPYVQAGDSGSQASASGCKGQPIQAIMNMVRSDPFSVVPWYRGIIFLDYLLYRYLRYVCREYRRRHRHRLRTTAVLDAVS